MNKPRPGDRYRDCGILITVGEVDPDGDEDRRKSTA
jgi:hypothetical protein